MVTYYSLLKHRESSKEKIKKFLTSEKLSDRMLFAVKLDRQDLLSEKKLFRKKNLTEKQKSDKISIAAEKAAQTDP